MNRIGVSYKRQASKMPTKKVSQKIVAGGHRIDPRIERTQEALRGALMALI